MKIQDLEVKNTSFLTELEQALLQQCGHDGFSFRIYYDSKINEYFLSLCMDGVELSKISWSFSFENRHRHVVLTMESSTPKPYQKKQYNTILRIATLRLVPHMFYQNVRVNRVASDAYNWISVYVLHQIGVPIQVIWSSKGKPVPIPEIPTNHRRQFFHDFFTPLDKFVAEMSIDVGDIADLSLERILKNSIVKVGCQPFA